MNSQDQLRQAYFPQYTPPPQEPRREDESSGISIATAIFIVLVVAGLALAAFWFGLVMPSIDKLKKLISAKEDDVKKVEPFSDFEEQQTKDDSSYYPFTSVTVVENEDDEEQEQEIDRKFVKINDQLGLLENAYLMGENTQEKGDD